MSPLPCPIYTQSRQHPEVTALEWGAGKLDYAELNALVAEAARKLHAAGINAQDRVAVLLPNSWQFVVLIQALFRIQAVVVPLSTRFPEATVQQLVSTLQCKMLVVDKNAGQNNTAQNAEKEHLIDDLVPETMLPEIYSNSLDERPIIDQNQQATILFSSGSTGLPKAILLSWGNHYYSALGSNKNIVLSVADRWLLSLPLYHVAGIAILFRCFVAGATVVLPPLNVDLSQVLQVNNITHVSMVSTQLLRLLDTSVGASFPYLKGILLGGSAISMPLLKHAHDAGWPIHTSYGMTETSSQVTTTPPGADLKTLCTSGSLLRHRELQFGDEGQILVRGKTRFMGLVTATGIKLPFDEAGWYDTGDLGRWDDQGYLRVLGRKDNMFISGGENIHPEEIERALELYAGINRAVVVPVSDAVFGFRPVAFIDIEGEIPDRTLLAAYLKDKIAKFMHPVAYFDLAGGVGEQDMKVSRKALQEKARQNLAR